jgi:hypothetical protein
MVHRQQQAVVVVVVIHLKELVATMLQQLGVLAVAVHMQMQQELLVRQAKGLLEVLEKLVVTIPVVVAAVQRLLAVLLQQPQATAVTAAQELTGNLLVLFMLAVVEAALALELLERAALVAVVMGVL